MKRSDFIKAFGPVALEVTQGTGIFPSVVMGMAILESASGESLLSSQYNNFFGIKAGTHWTEDTINLQTGEYVSGQFKKIPEDFRAYKSAYESFKDLVKLLTSLERYQPATQAETPQEQAARIQAGGYATDPVYALKVKNIIDSENLFILDIKKKRCKNLN